MKAGVDMPKTEYPEGGEVAGLDDYVALIKTIQADWQTEREDHLTHALWFRGQDDDWPLLPKVLRIFKDPDTGEDRRYNEFHILNTFTALYRNYITERFEAKSIELLAFMQHNWLPTRLLDWTQSALIGLYFAVVKATWNASETPVVWIMNPGKMNEFTIEGASERAATLGKSSRSSASQNDRVQQPCGDDNASVLAASSGVLKSERSSRV